MLTCVKVSAPLQRSERPVRLGNSHSPQCVKTTVSSEAAFSINFATVVSRAVGLLVMSGDQEGVGRAGAELGREALAESDELEYVTPGGGGLD